MQALLEGEQILDIRKGGLHEDGRHFSVQSSRLWLYPTVEHQRAELLKAPYARWVESTRGRGAARSRDPHRGVGRHHRSRDGHGV